MNLSEAPEDWNYGPMGDTIRYMRETEYHEWGFAIFRCAYGDEDAWDRYVTALKNDVHEDLEYHGRESLEQFASWTVVQGKDTLDQASKNRVREQFVEWRVQHTVSRHGPLVSLPNDVSNRLPRFTYCLYIDQKCLDKLEAHVSAKAARSTPGRGPRPPPLVTVIIDGDFSQLDTGGRMPGSQTYPAINGCTQSYVGWQYYNTRHLATLYDRMHREHLNGYLDYKRPPAMAPVGRFSMDN